MLKLGLAGVVVLVGLTACGSPTEPHAPTPSASDTAASVAQSANRSTTVASTSPATSSSAAAGSSTTSGSAVAFAPCSLVTSATLKDTLGTSAPAGTFQPTTVVGTGCRFTRSGAKSSVNILVETTADPAQFIPAAAYEAPPGSSSIPGADRGYVSPPAAGSSTSSIVLVKKSKGVVVTIFQDSPPVTASSGLKLAAVILSRI